MERSHKRTPGEQAGYLGSGTVEQKSDRQWAIDRSFSQTFAASLIESDVQREFGRSNEIFYKLSNSYRTDLRIQVAIVVRYDSATIRARAFKLSFISLISLSTSSMNWMMKSTILCLSMVSE